MSALLEVEGLDVRYGGVHAVSDVALTIDEGSVVGLIGPNGAGKTSMIDALTGYHRPAAGHVRFEGDDITAVRPYRRARRGLARTFQSIELFDDLTVEENLLVAADDVGVLRALGELLLARGHARGATDWAYQSAVSGTSRLARRRTSRTAGASSSASPGRWLDARASSSSMSPRPASTRTRPKSSAAHLRSLPAEGVSVLLVDHDMGLVLSVCDYVYVLDFGKLIAQGPPAEIRSDERVITAYLGSQKGHPDGGH